MKQKKREDYLSRSQGLGEHVVAQSQNQTYVHHWLQLSASHEE
jgi:hypothetical protein